MSAVLERIGPALENVCNIIGANSEVFTKGDSVKIDSDGFLAKAGVGDVIFGFALETATMASDNETVAKKNVKVQHALGVKVRMTVASALARTDVGNYADLSTATTGADTLSATTGTTSAQFFVCDVDPDRDGTLTLAIVMVSEIQGLVGASAAI